MADMTAYLDFVPTYSLDIQSLEYLYKQNLSRSQQIHETESARVLRLQIISLGNDNNDLHLQSLHHQDRIDEQQGYLHERQDHITGLEENYERTKSDLRTRSREVDCLKAELRSLEKVSSDSTKLLTEKLNLSRELSMLKPEVEHLRLQISSYQVVLGEKLILQRQLNTAQVELETEKQAMQRALLREGGRQAQAERLENRVENLQSELAKERREREKAERDVQRTVSDIEGKKTILESRLDAFRNKLRITKEQLKDAQAEMKIRQAGFRSKLDVGMTNGMAREESRNLRKRNTAAIDADAAIGTPGILPTAKRNRKVSTLPGDKSTFSITPFLNRITNVALESPLDTHSAFSQVDVDAVADSGDTRGARMDEWSHQICDTKVRIGPQQSVEGPDTEVGDKNNERRRATGRAIPARKMIITPGLPLLDEENNDQDVAHANHEGIPPKLIRSKVLVTKANAIEMLHNEIEVKKTRRKVLGGALGRTLFDDDGDIIKGGQPSLSDNVRGCEALGRIGQKAAPRLGSGASLNGFGEFSPLKKDRRAGIR